MSERFAWFLFFVAAILFVFSGNIYAFANEVSEKTEVIADYGDTHEEMCIVVDISNEPSGKLVTVINRTGNLYGFYDNGAWCYGDVVIAELGNMNTEAIVDDVIIGSPLQVGWVSEKCVKLWVTSGFYLIQ